MAGVAMTLGELETDLKEKADGIGAQQRLFWSGVIGVIGSHVKRDFDSCVSPDGTPWKPLRFPRARGGSKPLHDQGFLRASLTGGANHLERIEGNTLVYGTNLDYASTQHDGATIVPTKAKALAIPLTPAAARAGSPRRYSGVLTMLWPKGSSTGILAEFVGKSRGKAGRFDQSRTSDKGRFKAIYFLTKKVVVPARPFLGFGPKLLDAVSKFTTAFMKRYVLGQPEPPQQGGE